MQVGDGPPFDAMRAACTRLRNAKKDRIVCTTRSKSREETPKEGMDKETLSEMKGIVRCTNVKRSSGVFDSQ
jgi:hypothetical protein